MSANGAGRLPPEEARKVLRACRRGDRRAQARLVEAYLPVVRAIAGGYTGNGLAFDDLCQEGAIGLLEAIALFDPQRDRPFEPFAQFRIRRAIKGALTDQARLIRLPKHVVERRRTISRAEARLLGQGAPATPQAVAGETGLSVRAVVAARSAPRTLLSLDETTPVTSDPPDEALAAEELSLLEQTVARLPQQQQRVVARRWGLDAQAPVSASALAADLGVSPRRAQAIAHDALITLRRELEPTSVS